METEQIILIVAVVLLLVSLILNIVILVKTKKTEGFSYSIIKPTGTTVYPLDIPVPSIKTNLMSLKISSTNYSIEFRLTNNHIIRFVKPNIVGSNSTLELSINNMVIKSNIIPSLSFNNQTPVNISFVYNAGKIEVYLNNTFMNRANASISQPLSITSVTVNTPNTSSNFTLSF